MTELANKSDNALGALANLRKNITNTRQALPTSSTQPILRMLTDGEWVYGADNTGLTEDAIFVANPLDIKHGFVCWTDHPKGTKNKLKGEVYVGMASPPLDPASLPQHLDDFGNICEWKPAAVVQLVCIKGEDKGVELVYKPSSLGGTNFVDKLLAAVGAQLDAGSDKVVPHLDLCSDHYNHNSYGKTYTPEFKIVGWSAITETTATPAEEKPQRGGKKTKAEAGEKPAPKDDADDEVQDADAVDEVQDEAPKAAGRTRRRRRAS